MVEEARGKILVTPEWEVIFSAYALGCASTRRKEYRHGAPCTSQVEHELFPVLEGSDRHDYGTYARLRWIQRPIADRAAATVIRGTRLRVSRA